MKSSKKLWLVSLTLVSLPLCLSNSPAPWEGPLSIDSSSFSYSSSLVKNDLGDDGCYYSINVTNSGSDYIDSSYLSDSEIYFCISKVSYYLTLDTSLYFPIITPGSVVSFRTITYAKGSVGYSVDLTGAAPNSPTYVLGYKSSSFTEGISISSSLLTKKETTTTSSDDSSSSVTTKTLYDEKLGIINASSSTINSAIFVFTSPRGEMAFYDSFNSVSPSESIAYAEGYGYLNNEMDGSIAFSKAYFLPRNSYYDTNHNISPTSKTWWWLYIPLYVGLGLLALQLIAVAIILPIMHSKNKKKKD